jgi:MoaA/NifB/PqqE/SkfB family radical SAM enzyme
MEDPIYKSSTLPAPNYCCFCLTLKCSTQCKICHIWSQDKDFSRELTIEQWKIILKQLDGWLDKKNDIIITGGEPLLKDGILDFLSLCSHLGYKVSLHTNAFLIDEVMAKKIADTGLWRINISLYSLREEIHDFLKGGKGAFHKVMKALDSLARYAPAVGINIQNIIMGINLDEVLKMSEWVKQDSRIEYIYHEAPVIPFGAKFDGDWFNNPKYSFMWPQDQERVENVLNGLIEMKRNTKKIVNSISQLQAFKKYFKHALSLNAIDCNLGARDINIDPEGNVFLCFSKPAIGNTQEDTIPKIWNSKKADEVREQMKICKEKCHFLINCSFEEVDIAN